MMKINRIEKAAAFYENQTGLVSLGADECGTF